MGFSLVGVSRGYSLVGSAWASLVAERVLWGAQASVTVARAQLLCSLWDPPGSGIKPVSSASEGEFFTTEPPGKSLSIILEKDLSQFGRPNLSLVNLHLLLNEFELFTRHPPTPDFINHLYYFFCETVCSASSPVFLLGIHVFLIDL